MGEAFSLGLAVQHGASLPFLLRQRHLTLLDLAWYTSAGEHTMAISVGSQTRQ